MSAGIVWNDGDRNWTSLLAWLDVADVPAAIAAFEAAAGVKGDWSYDDDHGWDWWGLHGTFGGEVFTLYTHKSGTLKLGAKSDALDLAGLTTALGAIIGGFGSQRRVA